MLEIYGFLYLVIGIFLVIIIDDGFYVKVGVLIRLSGF